MKCHYFMGRTFLCYVLVSSCGSSRHTTSWLFRSSTLTYASVADLSKDQYIATLAFFYSMKWMETDAKLSLCRHKHFWKVRIKKLFSATFCTIKQPATSAQHSGKINRASERFFLRSLSTAATQHPNSPPLRRVQPLTMAQSSITLRHFLSHNLFLGLFTCLQKWASVPWRAGRHPVVWYLLSLNIRHSVANGKPPEKSRNWQSWKFHLYFSRLAWGFFSSSCQHRKMTLRKM